MTPAIIADSIVNICGAAGLGIAMLTLYRRDPKNPLTTRFLVALGLITLLFFMRGIAWWSGSVAIDRLSVIPAAFVPLGALIVTEGMTRRHAPQAAKIVIAFGGVLLGLGGALGLETFEVPYGLALSVFQLGSIAFCAFLLVSRDRASLSESENLSIGRLATGTLVALPFILTDFRILFPDIPVRLGALGALLVITAILTTGGGAETTRQNLLLSGLRIVSGLLLGIAAAWMSPDVSPAQVVRFGVVAVCGVLTIGLLVDTLRSVFESRAPGILNSLARSGARTRDDFIAELARHPIFAGARRYREPQLATYDPSVLRGFLSTRPILRRADAPWGVAPSDPAAERMASLMTANSATHVLVLSSDPIDLIALAVPVISADPATETALAMVHRLLALTPEQIAGNQT